jgi:hypothetical protein
MELSRDLRYMAVQTHSAGGRIRTNFMLCDPEQMDRGPLTVAVFSQGAQLPYQHMDVVRIARVSRCVVDDKDYACLELRAAKNGEPVVEVPPLFVGDFINAVHCADEGDVIVVKGATTIRSEEGRITKVNGSGVPFIRQSVSVDSPRFVTQRRMEGLVCNGGLEDFRRNEQVGPNWLAGMPVSQPSFYFRC